MSTRTGKKLRTPSSLHKALDVLEAFTRSRRELGISELAQTLGLPKSTVHRILAALQARAYVRQDPRTEKYSLGVRLFELGSRVVNGSLAETARPYMAEVLRRTGETVSLAILDGVDCLFVEELKSTQPVTVQTFVGARVPAHCAAAGKVLLAHDPAATEQRIEHGLKRYTPRTIVDAAALARELATARTRGYAIVREEWRPGISAVAAPISDRTRTVVASLVVTGPATRLDRDRLTAYGAVLRTTARDLSRDLGSLE